MRSPALPFMQQNHTGFELWSDRESAIWGVPGNGRYAKNRQEPKFVAAFDDGWWGILDDVRTFCVDAGECEAAEEALRARLARLAHSASGMA